jgi:CRP-like cAMP-binding protein
MLRPQDLRAIPLFRDITEEHLTTLTRAMQKKTYAAGEVLFRAGDVPDRFLLLVSGEVTLKEGTDDRFRLRPIAPIGELGSLTGIPRNGEAIAATSADVWSMPVKELTTFFEKHSDVALCFYRNLLDVVSDKVRRDRHRLDDMRANLIRTQKAMKTVRELVLSSHETPISKQVFETIDDLIEHNRRAHYRVTPGPSMPSSVRFDDGKTVKVIELSEGHLKLELPAKGHDKGMELVGVLAMPTGEIAVSGHVIRAGKDGVVLKLDLLIDAYKAALDDYVTRLQMLDYVV